MCVCARPGQSFRCKHALRETRQQLSVLPPNQIYSAVASYFRPHCSRISAPQTPPPQKYCKTTFACKIACLPVTARHSWPQHYSTYCDDAMSNIVIEMTLYVCPFICSSHSETPDSYLPWATLRRYNTAFSVIGAIISRQGQSMSLRLCPALSLADIKIQTV